MDWVRLLTDQGHVGRARVVELGLLLFDLGLDELHLIQQVLEGLLGGIDLGLQGLLPIGQIPQAGDLVLELVGDILFRGWLRLRDLLNQLLHRCRKLRQVVP